MVHFDFSEDISPVETTQKPSKRAWSNSNRWNEERTTTLKELWEQGYSASQIGKELGCTRNSIIGKAHRLDLPRRDHVKPDPALPPLPRKPRRYSHMIKMKSSVPLPPPAPAPSPGIGVQLIDLEARHCRFVIGSSNEGHKLALYCGQDKAYGPYCAYHARLCYNYHSVR